MGRSERLDVASLFRGTISVALLVEVVTGIMMLGSAAAFVISRSGLTQVVNEETAGILLLVGGVITLMFFLLTISFFVRVSRRIGRMAIWDGSAEVDLKRPAAKAVVTIYGSAIGLVVIIGMYLFYLFYKNYLREMATTSLSVFGFSISLAVFLLALLLQLVVIVIGRSAAKVIRTVLAEDGTSAERTADGQ
ncbi:MAG: hypothetical protein QXS20_10255 [Candidatus Thorarchaeota archaeon]